MHKEFGQHKGELVYSLVQRGRGWNGGTHAVGKLRRMDVLFPVLKEMMECYWGSDKAGLEVFSTGGEG